MVRFAHLDDCCGAQASFRDKTVHNETSKPKHLQLDVSNIAVTPMHQLILHNVHMLLYLASVQQLVSSVQHLVFQLLRFQYYRYYSIVSISLRDAHM